MAPFSRALLRLILALGFTQYSFGTDFTYDSDPHFENEGFEAQAQEVVLDINVIPEPYIVPSPITSWTTGGTGTAQLMANFHPDDGYLWSGEGQLYLSLSSGGTYVEQTITGLIPGVTYWISCHTTQRLASAAGVLSVFVDGSLLWSREPASGVFTREMEAFLSTGTSALVRFMNSAPSQVNAPVLLDWVAITEDGNPKMRNGNFEANSDISGWSYMAGPESITGWRGFGSRVLIENGEKGIDWGALDSGDGKYYVGIQDANDFLKQTVTGLSPVGTYTLSFLYAARPTEIRCETCESGGRLALIIEGNIVWQTHPSQTSFQSHELTFTATTPAVTIMFNNTSLEGDRAVFIDKVVIVGTLFFSNYDFEADNSTTCSTLTGWAGSGARCLVANGGASPAGCVLDSESGSYYLSLEENQ
eukprot:gene20055-24010_t